MKRGAILLLCLSVVGLGGPRALAGQSSGSAPAQPQLQPEKPAPQSATDPSRESKKSVKPSDVEKIRKKVAGLGIAGRVTVVLSNGNEYYGAVSEIGEDSFQVAEIDLNQQVTISYSDVKKVRSGFGKPNPFNGKRWPTAWHTAWALVAGGLAAFLIIVGAVASR